MELPALQVRGEGRVVSNFALTHFSAARLFAAKTEEIERAHVGQPFGNFWQEISIYCASSIVTAAASLEALINELFLEPGALRQSVPDFDKFFWGSKSEARWWRRLPCVPKTGGLERKPALEKYKRASKLLGGVSLSRSHAEYEAAEALIGFRNHLIHFKPLWDEARRDDRLEDRLNGKFALSPYTDDGSSFLEKRCMSAGCAHWSVATVANFVSYFSARSTLNSQKFALFTLQ